MNFSTLAQYLPGIAFLVLVNMAAALPFAWFIRSKVAGVSLSVLLTTVVLKVLMYIQIGSFDLAFVLVLIGIGISVAIPTNAAVHAIRRRFA